MKRLIIGTAGHIDHGKTTLVKALTGIETDRLKEEQQRGISIELGFAPFSLPSGQRAAIVDMPGHERFIRHMVAGAFGIDMVILTIAADEGVMPQTREHMDIIELLNVRQGIVVITKIDLVDEEWLMLMEDEIRQYIDKSVLKGAPLIPVSAVTGQGLDQLMATIEAMAVDIPEKPILDYVRLPIDRVFTMSGFGTVVTGTLWSGQIQQGDTLELMPVKRPVKVRTLQVHNEKVNTAYAGQRVAVNLQGIEVADIRRGNLLASSGYLTSSYRVDARLRLLPSSPRNLRNWNRIRFHLGTDEALGRIVLLDRDELHPGEEAYAQIVLEKPIVGYKGDNFVIRYYSPITTIGGGTIIDANAPKQKRFKEDVLEQLATKEEGSLYDVLLQEMRSQPEKTMTIAELVKKTGAKEEDVQREIAQLVEDEQIHDLKNNEYISQFGLDMISSKLKTTLEDYQQKYPLRPGYPKEDMRSRHFPAINGKTFNAILKALETNGQIKSSNNLLTLPGFQPLPDQADQERLEQIMAIMNQRLFNPPSPQELRQEVGSDEAHFQELLAYLLNEGRLVKISTDIYFSRQAIEEGKTRMDEYFREEKEMSLATARDLFDTSRKYALPLVEYYDKIRFTRRVGDMRVKM